jgi:hypothetical protein
VTDRKWPTSDSERTAEVLERLAARFREFGDKPIQLAHDFLKMSFPSSDEPGVKSFEETADAALSGQMMRDCTDYRAGLRFVHDVVADFDERTARILAVADLDDELKGRRGNKVEKCRECNEPILGRTKRLDGLPYHAFAESDRSACFWQVYNRTRGRRGA